MKILTKRKLRHMSDLLLNIIELSSLDDSALVKNLVDLAYEIDGMQLLHEIERRFVSCEEYKEEIC